MTQPSKPMSLSPKSASTYSNTYVNGYKNPPNNQSIPQSNNNNRSTTNQAELFKFVNDSKKNTMCPYPLGKINEMKAKCVRIGNMDHIINYLDSILYEAQNKTMTQILRDDQNAACQLLGIENEIQKACDDEKEDELKELNDKCLNDILNESGTNASALPRSVTSASELIRHQMRGLNLNVNGRKNTNFSYKITEISGINTCVLGSTLLFTCTLINTGNQSMQCIGNGKNLTVVIHDEDNWPANVNFKPFTVAPGGSVKVCVRTRAIAAGTFTFSRSFSSFAGICGNKIMKQIVVTGMSVNVLSVNLKGKNVNHVEPGEQFRIEFRIENSGGAALDPNGMTLAVNEKLNNWKDKNIRYKIPKLKPNSSGVLTVDTIAPNKRGLYYFSGTIMMNNGVCFGDVSTPVQVENFKAMTNENMNMKESESMTNYGNKRDSAVNKRDRVVNKEIGKAENMNLSKNMNANGRRGNIEVGGIGGITVNGHGQAHLFGIYHGGYDSGFTGGVVREKEDPICTHCGKVVQSLAAHPCLEYGGYYFVKCNKKQCYICGTKGVCIHKSDLIGRIEIWEQHNSK